jgi:uncharacterized damage-inducible protein DinB
MQDKDRRETPYTGDERATLTAFLGFHRDTLEWKCDGLTPAQLAERAVSPSSMSLLGLVRHLADVERGWFRRGVAGETAEPLFYSDDNLDGDFDDVDGATQADVDRAFAAWRAEATRADEIIAATELDQTFVSRRGDVISLRWVLVHLIEEYARHNGHADLLRERIDGATGE